MSRWQPSAAPEARRSPTEGEIARVLRERLPAMERTLAFQAANSRSFRFAARFFPPPERERVSRVYAWCRLTDDLVDRPPAGIEPERLLDGWMDLGERAYAGRPVELPLLQRVTAEMREAGVPFLYARELAEGMRMDLRGTRYATVTDLRQYTFRVAGTVGLWLTRLSGIDDPDLLRSAERMGHAMQFTNIVRDVGEDLRLGRLYLPEELLLRHGLSAETLIAAQRARRVPAGYAALLEELMAAAELDYATGLEALRLTPPSFARAAAVAAHVYRGIHDDVRRRGYDNLNQRARTGTGAKLAHAARAVWGLRAGQPVERLASAPAHG